MKAVRFGMAIQTLKLGAVLALGFAPATVSAQDGHAAVHGSPSPAHTHASSAFVQAVREVTRRFQDPNVAVNEGYTPMFGCVTGSSEGAMGVHFVNFGKVGNPGLEITDPEILLYEPLPNNRFRLTGVDYLVLADAWNAANPGPPQLDGQLFHYFESPNRFGLPAFYTLHVWAWKDNPQGTFANWNPNVSCDAYNPQN
jgi:hypothetical protein